MKYSISDLQRDFPDDDACLEWLVNWLYPDGITCKLCGVVTKHYKDSGRRSYSCGVCGRHMHPTVGTIWHNTKLPLTMWFYAMYLMSNSKTGVPAAQIQRQLGITYNSAWRMMHQIRQLMVDSPDKLRGEVEIDETFIHGNTYKRSSAHKKYGYRQGGRRTGEIILGMVERGGRVKVRHIKSTGARVILPHVEANVAFGSQIYTDGFDVYRTLFKRGYGHSATNHGQRQYVDLEDRRNHTQNIENVWSHLKRGLKATYRCVSAKHLQKYANEFAFRYSYRKHLSLFWALMTRISLPSAGAERIVS